jgi:diaminohydroxyphosphoribosylaminopyrimidine deaminase/5-amino-6-(5-phosphoribosylamino)uracil reductase
LRAQSDAVLVGTKTAIVDLPKLDARIDGVEVQPQAYVMGETDVSQYLPHARRLNTRDPQVALKQLAQDGIQSVLLEGGALLGQAFLGAGLVNEIWVFESDSEFGSGVEAPKIDSSAWKVQNQQRIGGDTLTIYVRA